MADTKNVPLAVDLDGTLIRTDMMFESLARLLRRNPFAIFQILFWWTRGRAWLKQKLAARVQIDPATLPYHEKFLAWLREEKKSGRKLILATASDFQMAKPIADHIGLFAEVLASDGKINLRSENKLRTLTEKFGERGFDYAGNSSADFAVWRGAREAIVVNASRAVLREAENCTKLGPTFCDKHVPLETLRNFCNELFWRSGYLMAAWAGLLLAAAFPKWSFAGLAWVAPALMIFAAYGKNSGDAFRVGYVAGFTFWLASLYWLLLMPVTGLPILGWLALSAFIALYSAVWVWLISNFKFQISNWFSRLRWSLGAAAAWVALEMIRARFLGGFPWSLLGVSQYKLVPLIQIASVTGVYGVSFLVVWFSLALFCAAQMILRHPTKRFIWQAEIVLPLTAIIFCFVGGFFAMNRSSSTDNFLRVTMIQPSIPQTVIWNPAVDENLFQDFLAQNEKALTNQTDVLIWPESAVPEMSRENIAAICNLAVQHHLSIIFNGEDRTISPTETNFYNAAFLVSPQGLCTATYHKQNLVIFGEYVPLVRWLPFLKWFTPIVGGWTPGEKPVTFQVNGLSNNSDAPTNVIYLGDQPQRVPPSSAKIGPLICFEDCFATTARDAAQDNLDFLINLTNDGWFGDSSEQWQHMANSVLRAVENGIPLLRCCNNGITCTIDAHGGVREILRAAKNSEYGKGVLYAEVPLLASSEKSAPTFYNRHGDWFGWGCVGVMGLMLSGRVRRHRKTVRATES